MQKINAVSDERVIEEEAFYFIYHGFHLIGRYSILNQVLNEVYECFFLTG